MLWTRDKLEAARLGNDLQLTTELLNQPGYSSEEYAALAKLPCEWRRTYVVYLFADLGPGESTRRIMAPNDEEAIRFAESLFIPGAIAGINEILTTHRIVREYPWPGEEGGR